MNDKNTFQACGWIVALTIGLLAGTAQASPTYTFTDLGTLGGTYSWAYGINDSGEIVGVSYAAGNATWNAVVWNGTTITNLSTLSGGFSAAYAVNNAGQVAGISRPSNSAGGWQSTLWNGSVGTDLGSLGGEISNEAYANAINNSGQVVGGSHTAGNLAWHATLWTGASVIDLGTLGGNISNAYSVNESGQVVGNSTKTGDPLPYYHPTLWNGTTPIDLGTLGGTYGGTATGINDAGQIVGDSYTNGNAALHATLWAGGTITDLGTLGGAHSEAYAINDSGQIVGAASTTSNDWVAVLWNGATAIDLNSLLDASSVADGWILQSAFGINDNGWIVGGAVNTRSGVTEAFLLAPNSVPEPATASLMLGALGLMGFAARRRKNAAAKICTATKMRMRFIEVNLLRAAMGRWVS